MASPQQQPQPTNPNFPTSTTTPPPPSSPTKLSHPLTSTTEPATARRPRDARLLHLILRDLGIPAYEQRVPLQLLDFAYRYTAGILSDAQRLAGEGYAGSNNNNTTTTKGGGAGGIGVTAVRQAIASRGAAGRGGGLGKEFWLEQAGERNRVGLPKVVRGGLPDEKWCLTGVGWGMKEEWSSEEEVEEGDEGGGEDEVMGGMDVDGDGDENGDGDGDGDEAGDGDGDGEEMVE